MELDENVENNKLNPTQSDSAEFTEIQLTQHSVNQISTNSIQVTD